MATDAQSETLAQLAPLRLSPRRIDVFALLLQGRSNKEVARDLCLSVETVKEHVGCILHQLGLRSADDPQNDA